MVKPLDRKLFRELWRLRGQVLAIALVVASGIGVLIMSLSTSEALGETTRAYYERYRFADIFASLERAPERMTERIGAIPGVQTVETRIVKFATLDISGFEEPVIGLLASLPERGTPRLNRLALRAGRFVSAGHPDEVVVSEPFAEAHELEPGDQFKAVINNRKRTLDVVGIALSPEYTYAIGPGSLVPDNKRFGILWLGREALAAAYDLDSAFNDVVLSLQHGVAPEPVIEQLDRLLEPYGGVGALARADQISNWFLMNELEQLETFTTVLPTLFLTVAAFLIHMVLMRLIAIERNEIGLLKAFGYSRVQIGWHYIKLVFAITSVGIVLGWGVGAWFGRFNTETYADFFNFPLLIYRPSAEVFIIGALVSLGAALTGTLMAVRQAINLPPAEAMRPPTPVSFKHTAVFDTFGHWLDQPTRILLRQLARRPIRSLVTVMGVASAISVLVMAMHWKDSIEHMVQVYFFEAQRQDMMVGMATPKASDTLHTFEHLPGVLAAEPLRIVGAKFRNGTRTHRGALQGVDPDANLQMINDARGRPRVRVPAEGVVLGTELAAKLDVGIGDSIQVEVLEGRRPLLYLPVIDLIETYIDLPAYIDINELNRQLRERPSFEYVNMLVDHNYLAELFAELKNLPAVSAVMLRRAAIDSFVDTVGEQILIFTNIFAMFSSALGFGVIYNATRIALSERGRELASLRVLGFSKAAISYILIGEVTLLIMIGIPLGCFGGWCMAWLLITTAFQNELYRMPFVIHPSTYIISTLVVVVATIISAIIVQRRVNHLDLIAVLKTRE